MTTTESVHAHEGGRLVRSVGFYGLMFVSLGSIIGSGWLLGALNAAEKAGPASILSWFIAAFMLGLLALVYAELGAAYPVAGAGGRMSYFSHGSVAGFTSGWASWLQAVFIAPIEVLACIEYTNSTQWVKDHFDMVHPDTGFLNARGYLVAAVLMLVFMVVNLAGAEFMSESNTYVVLWKFAVPVLAILVVATLEFNPGNFTAGGGFMPHGWHGVFVALTGGVVFATQGFEQAIQLAGEARNPKRDLSRAILIAMGLGATLYAALQLALIAAVKPSNVATSWDAPLGAVSDVGAWYSLALLVGAGWLAKVILVDAVISPAGTGVVYLGTTARLSYALGEEREMPSILSRTNARGVPAVSIVLATVIGMVAFGPFPSWNSLVNAVTGATAVMYGMAPIALGALRRNDPDRPRPYTVPAPGVVLPGAFASANLILYFGGFETMYKVLSAMVLGLLLFGIGSSRAKTGSLKMVKHAIWIPVWLGGMLVISALGRYGDTQLNVLPSWIDLLVVIGFSVAVYSWAVRQGLAPADVRAQLARDAAQLESADRLAG